MITIGANLFVLPNDSLLAKVEEEKIFVSLLLTGKTKEDKKKLKKNKFFSFMLFPLSQVVSREQGEQFILRFKEKKVQILIECQQFDDSFPEALKKIVYTSIKLGHQFLKKRSGPEDLFFSIMRANGFVKVNQQEVDETIHNSHNLPIVDAKLISEATGIFDRIDYVNPPTDFSKTPKPRVATDLSKDTTNIFKGIFNTSSKTPSKKKPDIDYLTL